MVCLFILWILRFQILNSIPQQNVELKSVFYDCKKLSKYQNIAIVNVWKMLILYFCFMVILNSFSLAQGMIRQNVNAIKLNYNSIT